MGVFEKLDELLDRLEGMEQPEQQSDEEVAEEDAAVEEPEQVETPEDAAGGESMEKMVRIIEAQQSRIDSLTAQIGKLVKTGANVNDGKDGEIATPPPDVPEEYEYLKDLDYSM